MYDCRCALKNYNTDDIESLILLPDPINCKSRIPSDGAMGYNVFGLEQDFIQISCSLTYTGNLSQTLEWNWPWYEVKGDERWVSAATSSVTSTLKLSPKNKNNIRFHCKARIEGAAQHTNSGLLWESETIYVRCELKEYNIGFGDA